MSGEEPALRPALRTPRSAAIAGIVFSLLLGFALVLVRLSIPPDLAQSGGWVTDPAKRGWVGLGVNLVPFAGIAFLWFIGVLRDRIGQHEDRFFATVLLGSGLLFVAMLFVCAAVVAGMIQEVSTHGDTALVSDAWRIDARITRLLLSVYAMRMAAVFMISVATITLRTQVMPRWVAFSGYGCALVLLVSIGFTPWVQLLFPLWVLVLSVEILRRPWISALPAGAGPPEAER